MNYIRGVFIADLGGPNEARAPDLLHVLQRFV